MSVSADKEAKKLLRLALKDGSWLRFAQERLSRRALFVLRKTTARGGRVLWHHEEKRRLDFTVPGLRRQPMAHAPFALMLRTNNAANLNG